MLFGIQTILPQRQQILRPVHGSFLLMITHLDYVEFCYVVLAPANIPDCTQYHAQFTCTSGTV